MTPASPRCRITPWRLIAPRSTPAAVGSRTRARSNGTARQLVVVELRRDGDLVWHVVDGVPPDAGTLVRGRLDWARRYAIMRYHSALHVMVGIVYRRFGAKVTGGAIYPDRARMDFSLENLNKDLVAAIEAQTNAVIAEDRAIQVRFVSREEVPRPNRPHAPGERLAAADHARSTHRGHRRLRCAGRRGHARGAHRRDRHPRDHEDGE